MQIRILEREGTHARWLEIDDSGLESQHDRDVADELNQARRQHKSLEVILAEKAGGGLAKERPVRVIDPKPDAKPAEDHTHLEFANVPEHDHGPEHSHSDLHASLSDVGQQLMGIRERLDGHAHKHEHDPQPVAKHDHEPKEHAHPHEHPHSHQDLVLAMATVQDTVGNLSADLAATRDEHNHADVFNAIRTVEQGLGQIESALNRHDHSHNHADYAPKVHEHEHEHELPKHGHPHNHDELLTAFANLEGLVGRLANDIANVGSGHGHKEISDSVAQLERDIRTVDSRAVRHDHPHEHEGTKAQIVKLQGEVAGHVHPKEPHEHLHEHANLLALIQQQNETIVGLTNDISELRRIIASHSHDYLSEMPFHQHPYLTELPKHGHDEYKTALEEHIEGVRKQTNARILSTEEVNGHKRLIVEEVD